MNRIWFVAVIWMASLYLSIILHWWYVSCFTVKKDLIDHSVAGRVLNYNFNYTTWNIQMRNVPFYFKQWNNFWYNFQLIYEIHSLSKWYFGEFKKLIINWNSCAMLCMVQTKPNNLLICFFFFLLLCTKIKICITGKWIQLITNNIPMKYEKYLDNIHCITYRIIILIIRTESYEIFKPAKRQKSVI